MKKYLLILMLCPAIAAEAQVPEDAIRYSWYTQNGTARTLAIGGAMGSLGGDISATFVNPAGLGMYRTREFVLSPGFSMNSLKADFRDSKTTTKETGFRLGTSGFIFGSTNAYNKKHSSAVAIAITQQANFNNTIRYKALNNFSSFSEQFAEEFAKSGYNIDQVLNTVSPLPYTSALGLQTYLIDTVRVGNAVQVRGVTENILDAGQAISQEMNRETSGGLYELAVGMGFNDGDKWLFGGTLGIPILNYKSYTTYSENDTSANTQNGFKSFTYTDDFRTNGVGVNLKFGAIFKPQEYLRLGIALHSPSLMVLTDKHSATLNTALETPSGNAENFSASSNMFTNGNPGLSKYFQSNAWRAILSGSYVFRETEDVTKQKGFITADVEYVKHNGSRFSSNAEVPTDNEKAYYKSLNNVVKNIYKGAFNFKVGGEVKFNTIMGRLGFGYYSNPYKNAGYKANQMVLSGGLGYRHKGVFADLTYAHQLIKDANFPYRLEDRANTYASTKQAMGNVQATIGWKF